MFKEYNQEQLWKLFEKLPEELKETVFSEDTANNISEVCKRYKIKEVSEIAEHTGYVLLGVLLPNDFQKTLEKDLGIDSEIAQKVGREIHRFIFYPVKTALEELYKIEITGAPAAAKPLGGEPAVSEKPDKYKESIEDTEDKETLKAEIETFAASGEKEEPKKEDEYREPVE